MGLVSVRESMRGSNLSFYSMTELLSSVCILGEKGLERECEAELRLESFPQIVRLCDWIVTKGHLVSGNL